MSVRVVTQEDAPQISAIYAPIVRDTFISFEIDPPDAREIAARIADTTRQFPWLVAENAGKITGYAYAAPHRSRGGYKWSCEVSAYAADNARRGGVGRALYKSLINILKQQHYVNAYAGIALPNPASVAFHEALGFSPVGVYRGVGFKGGAWRDVGWWSLKLGEHQTTPAEPIPFPEIYSLGEKVD